MKQVLAENLAALMKARSDRNTQPKVARATKGALNQTTISRILNQKHEPTSGTLEALADAFGLEPYQLLVPGLNPRNPQILRVLSPAEERLYRALDEARKPGTH